MITKEDIAALREFLDKVEKFRVAYDEAHQIMSEGAQKCVVLRGEVHDLKVRADKAEAECAELRVGLDVVSHVGDVVPIGVELERWKAANRKLQKRVEDAEAVVPDLLAACEKAFAVLDDCAATLPVCEALYALDAAIKKAALVGPTRK